MKFPHLLGRVTVAIGIVLGSRAAQATEFRSSDIHPDDYPTVLAVRHMGEVLSKATGGKHSIKVFAKGTPLIYINNKKVTDNRELTELKSENIKPKNVLTSMFLKLVLS